MNPTALLALFVTALIACGGRGPAMNSSAPGDRDLVYAFDLDAAPADYSKWVVRNVDMWTGVEGVVTIADLSPDPQFVPLFQIMVGSEDEWITLQMAAPEGTPPLVAQIGHFQDTVATELSRLDWRPQLDSAIRFQVDWSAAPRITFSVNGSALGSMSLRGPLDRLQFVATSGEMTSDTVRLCHQQPTAC